MRLTNPWFLAAALPLIAAALVGPRYGDTVLAAASHEAGGAKLHIDARAKDGSAISVGPDVPGGTQVPLADAMGNAIGTLTVAHGARQSPAAVAAWLARRIYVADNLAEADPFVPGAARAPRAQALVDATLPRFPDLVTLALHVAPPGGENIIAASSFGRIGKAADKDDLHVERDGAVLREVTNGGKRLAVELPLNDRSGHAIGALSTSFAVPAGADPQSVYPRALLVRDAMARRIASRAALFAR
jgi:iron complex outermembrane receptor protein